MDVITTSIIGSSVIDGSGMASKSQRARKRPENEPRKVERTSAKSTL